MILATRMHRLLSLPGKRMNGMQEFRSGLQLKAARTLAGATQYELAGEAGIHPKTIAYREKRDWAGMHNGYKQAVTGVLARHGYCFVRATWWILSSPAEITVNRITWVNGDF